MAQPMFKARKMIPGKDTISVMAMHYGLKPSKVRDIIKQAGAEVIREDGHRGRLVNLTTSMVSDASGQVTSKIRSVVWDDCQSVDPMTTKLTRQSIMAVADWVLSNKLEENGGDS